MAILFAATAAQLPFTVYPGVWVDSPASVLNELLVEQSGELGTGTFVALLGLFTGLVLILALLLAPRTAVAVVALITLVAFSVLTLRSEVDRSSPGRASAAARSPAHQGSSSTGWTPSSRRARAWPLSHSRYRPRGTRPRSAGGTRSSGTAESHTRTSPRTGTSATRTSLIASWDSTGRAERRPETEDAPRYVVEAPGDSRFSLAGREQAANLGFVVRSVTRPYRALWASRGLQADGWTHPGRPATIRVYGQGRTERVAVRITVRAPTDAAATYRLGGDPIVTLEAGEGRTHEVGLCLRAGSIVDFSLTSPTSTTIEGVPLGPNVDELREVGVNVGPVSVGRLGEC